MEIKNETITYLNQIVEISAKLTPILPIFFIASIAFYFWKRSGSSYGIKNRLYTLLSGNKGFYNKSLSTLWHEQQDTERFNALFNLNAKSTSDIIAFDNWIKKYSLDIKRFSQIKGSFNTSTRKIKKTSPWFSLFPFLFSLFLLTFSLSIAGLSFSDSALLQFKKEDQWIWLNLSSAHSVDINPLKSHEKKWTISSAECIDKKFITNTKAKKIGIALTVTEAICASFKDDDSKKYVSSALKSQRELLWLVPLIFIFSLFNFRSFFRVVLAVKTRRYLFDNLTAYKKSKAD